jgi:hypothetical protein
MAMSGSNDRQNERKSLREFGLTVGIAFGVLAALLFWRHKAHYIYFVPVSAALILLGLIVPTALRSVRRGWMAMAAGIGFVMARVILTILFFGVFTPLGGIARLLGRKFLDKDIDKSRPSYWVYKETATARSDRLEKQF